MNQQSSLLLDRISFRVAETDILNGVSVEVRPGRITAIIGRSGSGKTALLKIAAGQLTATSGNTLLNGRSLRRKSLLRRYKSIGYLPQKPMLPKNLTVEKVIRTLPGSVSTDFTRDRVITTIRSEKVGALSAGEKRYLELAIVSSLPRSFLILDEPLSSVEPVFVKLMIKKIRHAAEMGRGILLTDYRPRYIMDLADSFYLLDRSECYCLEGDLTVELVKMGFLK